MADYTVLTQMDVKTILKQYSLPELTQMKAMAGGQANSSFKITCGSERYILSVCDEKTPEEVKVLIQVLNFLNKHGFPSSRPVLTKKNMFSVIFNDKPVYIKTFIDGQVISSLSSQMLFQVGKIMATLHQLPIPQFVPQKFPYGKESFVAVIQSGMEHPYLLWLIHQKEFIDNHLDTRSEKGLIHGDIYWDNLLFNTGKFKALLDFEEACRYYLLYDIAMTCLGCCVLNGCFDTKKMKSLLAGYQSARKLPLFYEKQLKVFVVYAATAGSFWRFKQYNIKFPGHDKADSYKELAALADQASIIDWENLI